MTPAGLLFLQVDVSYKQKKINDGQWRSTPNDQVILLPNNLAVLKFFPLK